MKTIRFSLIFILALFSSTLYLYAETEDIPIDEPQDEDSHTPEMLLLEGSVLYEKGRTQEAITLLEKALEINPQYYDAAYRLGIIYADMTQYEKAIEYFKKAVEVKHDFTNAYLNLGAACGHLKRYNEALKYLDIALSQDKENPKIYYNISMVFFAAGDVEKGAYFLSRAKELSIKNNDKGLLEKIENLYKK